MEQIFEKINELFDEYLKTLNLENTGNAKLSIKEKITLAVWESNKNYKNFSVEVVETVGEALKYYFPNSDAFKEGIPFSQYLFGSLKNSINTRSEKDDFADKNGGLYISDDKYRRIKKVKNFFEDIRKIHRKNYPDQEDLKESFIIEKAVLALGMDEEEIRECLKMSKASTKGDEVSNEEGETFSIFDTLWDGIDLNPSENEFIAKEKRECILNKIQKEWEKKSDPMLSELLTVEILGANLDIENMESYSFLNKEIYAKFLKDPEHKLPENSEIAEKYGVTKSAASKKLSRFFESLKKNQK